MDFKEMLTTAMTRIDGWKNTLTGLGTFARDKLMSSSFCASAPLTPPELEAMFDDDMAARIVEKLPADALREGFKVTIPADQADDGSTGEAQEIEESIQSALDDLMAVKKLGDAWVWGRLFGGGALLMVVDDGALLSEELVPEKVRSLKSLLVLDRRDLQPEQWDNDPASPRFGEPLVYRRIMVTPGGMPIPLAPLVHWSRLLVFEGARTSMRRKMENGGWSVSVLQRVHDLLRQFATAWQATGHRMLDSSQGVFKMDGLIRMIASGGSDQVAKRMQVVDMGRSVARALVIDAEKESFEYKNVEFTGFAQILQQFAVRLAAGADMPLTVLMGQSPAGMNATGESDIRLWYDRVCAEQTSTLKPVLERLVTILLSAKDGPTSGVVPEDWSIEFPALYRPTEKEKAELRKMTAETDHIYITDQVVTPVEVAQSRFGAYGFSPETKIDLDLRQQLAEVDGKRAIEEATNPPEPPPAQGDNNAAPPEPR